MTQQQNNDILDSNTKINSGGQNIINEIRCLAIQFSNRLNVPLKIEVNCQPKKEEYKIHITYYNV